MPKFALRSPPLVLLWPLETPSRGDFSGLEDPAFKKDPVDLALCMPVGTRMGWREGKREEGWVVLAPSPLLLARAMLKNGDVWPMLLLLLLLLLLLVLSPLPPPARPPLEP
jgi:hypothetical protein